MPRNNLHTPVHVILSIYTLLMLSSAGHLGNSPWVRARVRLLAMVALNIPTGTAELQYAHHDVEENGERLRLIVAHFSETPSAALRHRDGRFTKFQQNLF